MSTLLRISDAASLALHLCAELAKEKDSVISTARIADRLSVSENHLSKVAQRLAKAGFVEAVRGPNGGFKLTKDAGDISLLEIFEAIEGPLRPANCLLKKPACNGNCILGDLVVNINRQVSDYFKGTTLSQLADHLRGK